jgi:hypothetical protein
MAPMQGGSPKDGDTTSPIDLRAGHEALGDISDDELSGLDSLGHYQGGDQEGTKVVALVAEDVQRAIDAGVSIASTLIAPLPKSQVARLETEGLDPYVIRQSVVIVGRSKEVSNLVIPDDDQVSRQHAALIFARGDFYVEDLASSNGTFVGGRRITCEKLKSGDEIRCGAHRLRLLVG